MDQELIAGSFTLTAVLLGGTVAGGGMRRRLFAAIRDDLELLQRFDSDSSHARDLQARIDKRMTLYLKSFPERLRESLPGLIVVDALLLASGFSGLMWIQAGLERGPALTLFIGTAFGCTIGVALLSALVVGILASNAVAKAWRLSRGSVSRFLGWHLVTTPHPQTQSVDADTTPAPPETAPVAPRP